MAGLQHQAVLVGRHGGQVDDRLLVLSRTQYPTAAFADYFKFGFVRDRQIAKWRWVMRVEV